MAKRDVDLVIRARNEASKAIDSITAALREFSGAQKEINADSDKTKSALGELGQSLRQLQQAFGGSAAKKVAGEISKAREEIVRLGRQMEETTGEAIGFTREYRQAAAATEKLRQEASQVAATVKQQSAALKESATAQRTLNTEINRAAKDRAKLEQADRELSDQIERQRLQLTLARGELSKVSAELSRALNPTARLQNRFASLQTAVAKGADELNELQTRQGAVRNAIGQTDRVLERANQKLQDQTATYDRLNASLTRAKDRQAQLNAQVEDTAKGQERLEKAARESAGALERQDKAYADAAAELQKLEGAVKGTAASFRELSGESRQNVLRAFGQQRQVVRDARAEWAAAQERVKALAADMRSVSQPTAQMAAAFEKAQAAARASKANFEAQREVLLRLRDTLRESGGNAIALGQRFDSLTASVGRATNAERVKTQATERAAAADRALAAAADRAAGSTSHLATGVRGTAGAMQRSAAGATTFSAALRQFYGDSRTALSFTQRLRSEVLALASAYLGFFAVFRGVSSVVDAFRTLEAAQNRLGVVFDQNQGSIAREIDFLRREADRLGISFKVLSDEYAKFAVAADAANFSNEAIRETFTSVAEAGRVNKLSIEQLNGIFLALQQIISKGKVQSEELRRQLGDRLPGAFNIMADALNVTTAELDRMLKAGEVVADQDTLLAFARELQDRFGDQLPAALKSTTTEIGRFQNSLFEAALTVAQGGFIDAFTNLLRNLNEQFKTADFQAFLQTLSSGLAGLTDLVSALVSNWDLLIVAATGFVATKIAPFIVALAVAMGGLQGRATGAATGLAAVQARAAAMGVQVSTTTIAVRRLTRAFRALTASTGLGLLVTGIGLAIGAWATRADEATEAIHAHEEAVRQLKTAYDGLDESTKSWAETIENVSITQARDRLRTFRDQLEEIGQDISRALDPFGNRGGPLGGSTLNPVVDRFRAVLDAFRAGEVSAKELRTRFDELAESSDGLTEKAEVNLLNLADALVEAEKRADEAAAVVEAKLATSLEEADAAMAKLGESTKNVTETTGDIEKYTEAMEILRGAASDSADALKRMEEEAKLEDALRNALKFAETAQQAAEAVQAWNAGMDELASKNLEGVLQGQGRAASFAERTLQLEGVGQGGGTSTAQAPGVLGGFIEKTWLDLFRKHFPDQAANLTEKQILDLRKERDLVLQMVELLAQENAKVLRTLGESVDDVSLRLAHLLGPSGAAQVLRAPPDQVLSEFLPQSFIDANQGLLGGGRTAGELLEITREQLGLSKQEFEARDRLAQIEKDRAEEADKQREATQKRLEDLGFSIEQQRLLNSEKDREAAIEEAVRAAKQENENITDEQLSQIREQVGLLFDLQNATKALEEAKKRAAEADQEVNNLLAIRTALQERLTLLQETGAPNEQIIATRNGIEQINEQLLTAIERAIGLFEALGGTEADAAIAKLQTLRLTLQTTGQSALIDFKKVGGLLTSGLTNAFDSFAQAVAKVENTVKSLGRAFQQFAADFLRLIAQMILKQAILNALQSIKGNPFSIGVGHSGGIAGSLNRRRTVDPSVFFGALRYHGGGIAGLKPNEVPIIAERGEELVPDTDPRHRKNFSEGSKTGTQDVKVVNAFDSASFLEEAMQSGRGENVILNFIRANPTAIRAALGV